MYLYLCLYIFGFVFICVQHELCCFAQGNEPGLLTYPPGWWKESISVFVSVFVYVFIIVLVFLFVFVFVFVFEFIFVFV